MGMGAMGATGARALLALLACLCASADPGGGPVLLYTTKYEVRTLNLSKLGKPTPIIKGLEKGIAVDYYLEHPDIQICWTDFELEKIKCVQHNVSNPSQTQKPGLVISECASYGLAVDWYTRKLYWTDREKFRIEVASLTENQRKVLFWSDIDEPRAIAVAPMKGLLFWTDWGEVAKIERAAMNGDPDSRKVIVDTKIFWPNALTIDYETNKIYWLDAKLLFIDVMDFDGKNRNTIMKDQLVYAVSLTIFHDKLYWADWKTWYIYSWDISTKGPVKSIMQSEKEPTDVKVWDDRRQPRPASPHPCSPNNGNCSHLCLLSPNPPGYSCACPTGVKLINKYECADGPQSQLILVQKMAIRRISLDSPDYTSFVLPLKEIKSAVTVDYDPIDGYIYWIDGEAFTISRAKIDGSNQSVVLQGDLGNLDGIAVDSIAGNIYWTDPFTDTITVARLDGSSRKVIIHENLANPRAIALATSLGWMFWSDWSNHNIERASLDGTDRIVLVSKDIGWPNGIALDVKEKKLYWGDAFIHKIGVCNMDGTDRRELLSDNLHHIFGMTLLGNYIYWTDWQRRSLSRVNKLTGGEREVIAEQFQSVMGLTAFDINQELEKNPCFYNNGNCSHFCFNRPKDYVCGCPIGLEFARDNKTCIKPSAFLLFARKDNIEYLSVENSNYHIVLPVKDIKDASAIALHVADNRVYWADSKLKTISRCSTNGSHVEKIIEWTNIIDGLAVDWNGGNIYWTDLTAQRIEVARLDGSHRRVLIWQGLKKPKSITLDPANGYMYWSEWGKTIKRAYMDGSHPTIIIDQVGRASALNIDHERGKLIWGTMDPPCIEIADLNGSNRKKLISDGIKTPYSLAVGKDFVYWADLITGDIKQASIVNGNNNTVIYRKLDDISSMVLYHSSLQTYRNPCSINNGGCSHLCLSIPSFSNDTQTSTYKCACTTHYILNEDNHTCSAPSEFILFSHRNGIGRVITGGSDCPDASLTLSGLKSVKAIEYDPIYQHIYWIDGRTHSIRYMSESGGGEVGVVAKAIGSTVDMALDAIGRAIYFTCPESMTINMTKLDNNTSSIGVVIHGEGIVPKHIAIHQTQRLLFWVDTAKGVIMSSSMDGSNRVEIAQAPNISALALNPFTDTVFWANSKQIYASSLDGSNKRMIWQGGSVMSLAILKSTLYWIDNEKHLMHLPLNITNAPALPVLRFPPLTDVIAVYKLDSEHPCINGGGCPGVCLAGKVCGCVRGLLYNGGGRCSLPPPCGPNQFICAPNPSAYTHLIESTHIRECIPEDWRCDGQDDCPNASDETDCNKCPEGKFKCLNDQCIDYTQVCDGVKQCADGHDEFHCCSEPRSFRCPNNGVCINSNFVCDQINHCTDGSDESPPMCAQSRIESPSSNTKLFYIIGVIGVILFGFIAYGFFYCRSRILSSNQYIGDDKAADPLSPKLPTHNHKIGNGGYTNVNNSKTSKMGIKLMEGMRMSAINGSSSNSYDRNHITGASSSATNGSSFVGRYPREPLNPPPSPATTAPSSSAPSRHRPYRRYKVINQPPPPTPCSTDVCDESDCTILYPVLGFGAYLEAPPPTPCPPSPPSPSSRSSTYFSPLPPPPSPVPPHYDS